MSTMTTMTRLQYIQKLANLRETIHDAYLDFLKAKCEDASMIETDRRKKTGKMFEDLTMRLFEDEAISQKIKFDKWEKGEGEQRGLFDQPEPGERTELDPEGRPLLSLDDADETPGGKPKKRGKKGGKA